MKKLALASLAVAILCLVAEEGSAHGRRRGGDCAPGYAPGYTAACAPVTVTYVDQVMTGYRPVMKSKKVDVMVTRMVTKEYTEKVKYTEMVPKSKKEKRTAVTYRCITESVPVTYHVNVPVITPVKTKQTVWTCVPTEVVENVTVCRMVPCQVVDPCTGCVRTVCQRVTDVQPVKRVVMRPVSTEQDVVINQCTWKSEERKGTRLVPKMVEDRRDYEVDVWYCEPVQKDGVRTYYRCEPVQEKATVTQYYCEYEQYQYTVRVPVYTAASCAAPCGPAGPAVMPGAHH
jgi:hypothetical protein